MTKLIVAAAGAFALTAALTASTTQSPKTAAPAPSRKPPMAAAHPTEPPPSDAQAALVKQYCAVCHSEKGRDGGLSLVDFDPAHADQNAEIAEKMIRKLRAGMMPPPGARRPEGDALKELVSSLE